MGMKLYDYKLEKMTRLVDGDTQDVILSGDFGFHLNFEASVRIRLMGVDTPELNKAEQRNHALQASTFAAAWYVEHAGNIRVATYREDSFGRWLASVYCNGDITQTLSRALVEGGFQKPDSRWGPMGVTV